MMGLEQLAVVRGWAQTRATLARWRAAPGEPLRAWARGSLLVAVGLLAATWVVATLSTPDPTPLLLPDGEGDVSAETLLYLPGVTRPARLEDFGWVLVRNALVLTLHALACVAGFIAGSSLPEVARGYSGWWRRLHELAGPAAIAFVVAATLFSLATQAYLLGGQAATLASELGLSPAVFLLALTPHALPELFALFLPLAAWTIASRRGAWHELLAATVVTVALAVPLLLASAVVETWLTPRLLLALTR